MAVPAAAWRLLRAAGDGRGPARSLTIDGLSIFRRRIESDGDRHEPREILWDVPVGNGPMNHPLLKGRSCPGSAITFAPGAMVKTLLFVNAQRLESLGRYTPPPWKEWGDPDMDRKLLYVFDKQSGALLREIELDGLSAAIPMTYLVGGKQYIALATGGGEDAQIVALTLPGK